MEILESGLRECSDVFFVNNFLFKQGSCVIMIACVLILVGFFYVSFYLNKLL